MSWGVAMCPGCGAVLVMTLHIRKAEFYCLECGRSWGWLDPDAAAETPELLARVEAVKAEFQTLAEGLIGDSVMLKDCPRCGPEAHEQHATPEQLRADAVARQRLADRIGQVPG